MSEQSSIHLLPYTSVVGQEQLKLALELAYIAPRIGGVLLSGERGTGKSTIVRAFSQMMYNDLPITIPINATEDRVVGGWQIDELMRKNPLPKKGLLEEANGKLLYIDEVNLLDDHIVNIILDVTSTGMLIVQREGLDQQQQISFTLVGTMNPEEGNLRPQLLDRFGLMVQVRAEADEDQRRQLLQTVLNFDEVLFRFHAGQPDTFFKDAAKQTQAYKEKLEQARKRLYTIEVPPSIAEACVTFAHRFKIEGHRGDYVLVLAARAYAARKDAASVTLAHLREIAPLALQHRRSEAKELNHILWGDEEAKLLEEIIEHVES